MDGKPVGVKGQRANSPLPVHTLQVLTSPSRGVLAVIEVSISSTRGVPASQAGVGIPPRAHPGHH